jgi:hypothetical protein
MKTSLALLGSFLLLLCGCAHQPVPALSGRAIDLIQPGSSTTWSNGTVVQVGGRNGDLVQDIRVVGKAADGRNTTVTAKEGTLKSGSTENPGDPNCVRLVIPAAQGLHGGSRFPVYNMMLTLTR